MKQIRYRRDLNQIINLELPCAELGCAEGYFSADMLRWGIPTLYLVDAWATLNQTGDGGSPQEWHDKNYRDAMNRVKEFGDKVKVLRGKTVDMAVRVDDESLGLVYLDAGHSYENVKEDLKTWYPKVVKGGVIAGHDFLNQAYGVQRAVREFAKTHRLEVFILKEDKDEDAGFYFFKP